MEQRDVLQVYTVRSGEITRCPICDELQTTDFEDRNELQKQVNHLLGHNLMLLHVGQESVTGADGEKWENTVAVLGIPK